MLKKLSGKKAYLTGAAMIAYALLGYYNGAQDFTSAMKLVMEGVGVITLRAGIAKAGS